MIELDDIAKDFYVNSKVIPALSGITLRIGEGEVIAVCGPSGAGKSTLLHILGLMDRQTSGTMKLFDEEVGSLGEKRRSALRNRNIGFLFQFHYLIPDFTVMENLLLPVWIKDGAGGAKRESELRSLLDSLGIGGLSDRYPAELSGGEQQRAALARAVVNDPKLILADEPTGNLDSRNSGIVLEMLFRKARESGTTLVVATHDMELAGRAHKVINLKDGTVAGEILNQAGIKK